MELRGLLGEQVREDEETPHVDSQVPRTPDKSTVPLPPRLSYIVVPPYGSGSLVHFQKQEVVVLLFSVLLFATNCGGEWGTPTRPLSTTLRPSGTSVCSAEGSDLDKTLISGTGTSEGTRRGSR